MLHVWGFLHCYKNYMEAAQGLYTASTYKPGRRASSIKKGVMCLCVSFGWLGRTRSCRRLHAAKEFLVLNWMKFTHVVGNIYVFWPGHTPFLTHQHWHNILLLSSLTRNKSRRRFLCDSDFEVMIFGSLRLKSCPSWCFVCEGKYFCLSTTLSKILLLAFMQSVNTVFVKFSVINCI